MKFLGMGGFEFVIILIVILIIFGPKNLPKLGKALGSTVSNLRDGMNEGKKKGNVEGAVSEDAEEGPAVTTAEIEGVVEDCEGSPAAAEASGFDEAAEGDVIERAEAAAIAAEQAADEAFEPKKVRRVVKKKVAGE